jgi:aryl-alcohol dehydrogenase-like predicted oxidoreductase
MQYTSLGCSGLQVSRLALGTMNFGELTDQTARFQIMDAAIEAGINFFDTADVYGGPQRPDMEKGYGTSEEIIGRWLAQGGRRDRSHVHRQQQLCRLGYIATAQSVAASRHFVGLASEQSLYNLSARTIELEVIPGASLLRHRSDSLEPDRHGTSRGCASKGDGRTSGQSAVADAH